jgi:hypothetical protein
MCMMSDISTKLQSTASPAMHKINTCNGLLCLYKVCVAAKGECITSAASCRVKQTNACYYSGSRLSINWILVFTYNLFFLSECLSATQLSMKRLITRLEKQVQYNIYWLPLRYA